MGLKGQGQGYGALKGKIAEGNFKLIQDMKKLQMLTTSSIKKAIFIQTGGPRGQGNGAFESR